MNRTKLKKKIIEILDSCFNASIVDTIADELIDVVQAHQLNTQAKKRNETLEAVENEVQHTKELVQRLNKSLKTQEYTPLKEDTLPIEGDCGEEGITTPLTDAEEYQTWTEGNQGMGDEYADNVVDADFARRLEYELSIMLSTKNEALGVLKRLIEDAKQMTEGPVSTSERVFAAMVRLAELQAADLEKIK